MMIDELRQTVENYLSAHAEASCYTGDDDYHMLHLERSVQYWRDELWRLTA
jgi:hypothetical protein